MEVALRIKKNEMKKNVLLTSLFFLIASLSTAQVLLISSNSVWKYKDDGSNQGTAWYGTTFNDASWASGAAELGYGDGDEATFVNACGTVVATPTCTNKYITTYFRQTFNIANPASYTGYTLNLRRDDGIVLYVNGTEIYRENMPTGTITHTTVATAACADDGTLVLTPTIPSSLIVTGTNVIAAEIHQNAGSSSDLTFILSLYASTSSVSTQFSSGNVVVLQAGNGLSALSSTATPIFLREFSPNGDILYTYTVPVTSNTLTMSGSATSEGALTLSSDNTKLILVGYNAAVGTTGIAGTTSSAANRMVAAVDATSGITYTGTNSYFSANNIRCGASDGAGNFWTCGAATGLCYMGTVSAAAITQSVITNLRQTQIFNGDLYFSTTSGTSGIYKVGTGLPVTSGQTNSLIINTSTVGTSPAPNGFYFNPAMTICYIADDRATGSAGGIQKWVNSSGTWTLAYTFSTSLALNTIGARGVIADFSGGNPVIYGTSAEGSNNRLFKIVDGGSVASSTISTLATAVNNTIFRGVAFSPTLSSCTTASISSITSNTNVCITQSLSLNVTAGGTAPFTYTWSGPGALSSNSINNPGLANPVSGNYTVTVSNGCGTASATVNVSVNPSVTLAVSPVTICAGSSATLNASGAATYTWNTSSNSSSISVSPAVTTNYTLSGTSLQGCSNFTTTQVVVNATPTITANSATICSGAQATLTASGAATYTWSTSNNNASITASPISTSNYTVTGTDANNCVNSATTSIIVTSSPTITVVSSSICVGQTGTISASGALSYTWSTAANSSTINDNPTSTTVYSVSGNAGGCLANGIGTITVNPLPILTINSGTICSGNSATLSGSGATTYTWNTSSNTPSISVSPTVTTNYTLSGTSLQGCTNFTTTQVIVNSNPTITANSATICSGGQATLSASGAVTYTWNTSSNVFSISLSPTVTTNYTVTGTDANNCVNSATTSIVVTSSPSITVVSTSICAGQTGTISASGALSYTWSTAANSNTINDNPTSTTVYSVTGNAGGCLASGIGTITVNPLPILTINSGTICSGNSATLSGSGATTYTWNTSSNTPSISVSPTVTTNYTLSGTSLQGCTNFTTTQVIVNSNPTITANSATICSGAQVTLTANGANTYTWNTSSNSFSTSVSPLVTTNYTVSGTSLQGCTNFTTTQIIVNSNPTITINSATICSGAQTTLTANGASTYTWNTSNTSSSISVSPIVTTNYTLSGTSLQGCTNFTTAQVVVIATPTITVNSATICAGEQATLTASGATTYSWSNGSTSNSIVITPTATSVYTVNGTSASCVGNNTAMVAVNPLPVINAPASSICSGGSSTLTASGAASYTWNTGSNSASITATPSINTTYTVSGTSLAGCVNSTTTAINITASPSIAVTSVSVCTGSQATLVASGVNTYTWNTGATTSTIAITPTASVVYTVSGNASGCVVVVTNTLNVTVNLLPTLSVNSATVCPGTAATLVISGANTYSWNTGSSSATINPSPSVTTTYSINGTSAFGCVNSTTAMVVVNPLPTMSINAATICSGGQATLTANGATSYLWNTTSTSSSIVVTPTVSSSYTVTGSAFGCSSTSVTNVFVNPLPNVSATSASICVGNTATLTASGASSYSWSNGANTASASISPTATTVYTVTGTSLLNCSTTATTQVFVNSLPSLTINSATLCSGATATLTVSGASSYSWNTGSSSSSITPSPSVTTTYTVSGTSSLSCVSNATTQVLINATPTITVNSATICAGGQATLTASGATTYSWSNGSTSNSIVITPTATGVYTINGTSASCVGNNTAMVTVNPLPVINAPASSICSGGSSTLTASGAASYTWNTGSNSTSITATPSINTTYTVSGTSLAGCVNSTTTAINITASPSIAVTSVSVCAGSQATLLASGVNTYTWNTGATTSTIAITPTASAVYTVSGNASGCSAIVINTLNVTVNPLPILTLNSATICAGTSATLSASGANTYSWSTGAASASIIVSPTVTNSYSVIGTSSLGCVSNGTAQITVNLSPTLVVTSSTICSGSTSTLTVSGANTYSWNTGATSSLIVVSPSTTTTYTVSGTTAGCSTSSVSNVFVNNQSTVMATSATICSGTSATLIASGASTYTWSTVSNATNITVSPTLTTTYTLFGTSAQGCTNTSLSQVIVNVLPTLTVNSPTICSGNSATLSVSGASTYMWSNSATVTSIAIPSLTNTTTYSVSGTSSLGCVRVSTTQVIVTANPTVVVNSSTVCAGNSTTLIANGANSYSWSTSAIGASITVSPTTSVIYSVTGTALGCSHTATASVFVNSLPTIVVNSLTICSGGSGTLTASGANTYTWNTSSTSASIVANPTITANYTVTGTSTAGCINSVTTSVAVSNSPAILVNSTVVCAGSSATLLASGVSSYTWSNGSNSNSIVVTPVTTSVYSVSGNASGCAVTASNTSSVSVNALPLVTVPSTAICAGTSATLNAIGATTYTWSTGANGNQITVSPLTTSVYSVAATQNGCVNTATALVTVNNLPNVTISTSTAICVGSTATLVANGALNYTWSSGPAVAIYTISPITTTAYSVTGSSAQGCIGSAFATVTVNALPSVSLSIDKPLLCLSDNTLNLTGTPSGGTYSGTAVSGTIFNPLTAGVGTYTLTYTYTDANNCLGSNAKVVTVDLCNGIKEKELSSMISIYPNPALTELWVKNESFDAGYTIEIADVNGKQVYSIFSNQEVNTLNLNGLSNGIYILRVTANNKQANLKFIKN
jgi:hypothetical protein